MQGSKGTGIGVRTDYAHVKEDPLVNVRGLDAARREGVHDPAVQKARRRVAAMLAQGITPEDVARLCNVDVGVIQYIQSGPEYTEERQKQARKASALNNGWDAIETLAIKQTLDYLQMEGDPIFALQAAKTANGMKRRNASGESLSVTRSEDGTPRVVIQLGAQYVQKLQDGFTIDTTPQPPRPERVSNSMDYVGAEKMMSEAADAPAAISDQQQEHSAFNESFVPKSGVRVPEVPK